MAHYITNTHLHGFQCMLAQVRCHRVAAAPVFLRPMTGAHSYAVLHRLVNFSTSC